MTLEVTVKVTKSRLATNPVLPSYGAENDLIAVHKCERGCLTVRPFNEHSDISRSATIKGYKAMNLSGVVSNVSTISLDVSVNGPVLKNPHVAGLCSKRLRIRPQKPTFGQSADVEGLALAATETHERTGHSQPFLNESFQVFDGMDGANGLTVDM